MADSREEKIFKQISKQCVVRPGRGGKPQIPASEAQRRLIAHLIVTRECRWDDTEVRGGMTTWQASNLINSLQNYPVKEVK